MKSVSVIDLVTLLQVSGRVISMALATREADAEFVALISASFSEPPAPPPTAPPRVPPRPGIPCPPSRRPSPGPAAITSPAILPAYGRQRSPPAHRFSRPPGRCP